MKKRILSVVLVIVLTLSCFSGVHAAQPGAGSSFNPDDHLIKVSSNRYQIISLNGAVTMSLFADASGQWSYSLDKTPVAQTSETLALGNVDFDAEGKVTVRDILKIKNIIMTGECTERERMAANANQDEQGNVDVADIAAVKNAIMSKQPIGEVEFVTTTATGRAEEWVRESDLGIVMNGTTYFNNATVEGITVTETDRTYDHMGNQSVLHDNGVAAEVKFKQGNTTYYLDARVYDNGIAFRYRMPGTGNRTVNREMTTFALRNDVTESWYGVNNRDYEAVIEKHNPNTASNDKITAPLTAVVGNDKGYIAVQEAGVGDVYGGTNLYALGNATYKIGTTWDGGNDKDRTINGEFATGWRLISVADTLNDLVNNYNVYHVNDAPDPNLYGDTSWIEPGRSAWSWLTDYGATLGNPDAMYEFTLNASRLGFEYNVIDEGYRNPGWGNYEATLANLGAYGEELGVKQLLWAFVNPTHNGYQMTNTDQARNYLDFLARSNIYGGKVDFWWSEENPNTSKLQHEILKMAAERKLIINFHGCNKPGGVDATYPNELNREAIRGLENIGDAQNTDYTAQSQRITTQLFTRYLSGHADWTPACDTAMQMATMISIDAPLNVIATNPQRILENPAVEMIKSIPTVWDQTIVLSNSKIGDSAVYAKESHGNWFLGGTYNVAANNVTVDLGEFLGEGNYMMELWVDTVNASGKVVPVKTEKVVTADDVLQIGSLRAGHGFAARFSKIAFNHFGGEIIEPIVITTADKNAVVKYTIDGTDPATSNTAKLYEGPISLTDACDLRAAIVEGDDVGAAIKGNFNVLNTAYLAEEVSYGAGKTTVTLKHNGNGTVKYTTDGSNPATSGTAKTYTQPLELTEACVVKAICSLKNGDTASVTVDVYVNSATIISPDVYVGNDYVSARTDWGNIYVNQSMNGDGTKISLGGTTVNNGTKYDHGFSFNANGTIVYNVPKNAAMFVGMVGIDDRTWETSSGAAASSTCSISFDGVEYLKTPVFHRGDALYVAVNVPAGAKQITIAFGDGGNGINFDNVAMGNAGWVLNSSLEGAPDVHLAQADLVSSSSGWYADPASINQNTKGNTISIGGVTYPYGISTNSVGHFTFNVPANATKFVGIAGVDDCTYDNPADGAKASITVSISFDGGTPVYTSGVIRQGGSVTIQVNVPKGAKQITINFGDGGDGITCDNASMGNAGWIIG